MAFGLYVHWPYCESKCPYCDFNSHVANAIDAERWVKAYQHEIERVARSCPDEILSTIFIGGGTPSLMKPEIVDAVLGAATRAWRTANDLEITMEANPGSVDAARFRSYASAGINRVSLGIQSLDDTHLRMLGRKHGRADALAAIEIAQNTFSRVNIDLIYARQNQTIDDWHTELSEAISLGTGHMSLYQLTIEDGTVFAQRHKAGHLRGLPGDDSAADMFELTQNLCTAAGLPAYEVSNHAEPGEECRHNMIYWQGGRYAGIGPGAHGRINLDKRRVATEALRDPGQWLRAVEELGNGEHPGTSLTNEDQITETLLMGLRISEGLPLAQLEKAGLVLNDWQSQLDLIAEGYLEADGDTLKTTPSGRLLLNSVIGRLLQDLKISQS